MVGSVKTRTFQDEICGTGYFMTCVCFVLCIFCYGMSYENFGYLQLKDFGFGASGSWHRAGLHG